MIVAQNRTHPTKECILLLVVVYFCDNLLKCAKNKVFRLMFVSTNAIRHFMETALVLSNKSIRTDSAVFSDLFNYAARTHLITRNALNWQLVQSCGISLSGKLYFWTTLTSRFDCLDEGAER